MFCDKCGTDLGNQTDLAFCPNCGNPMNHPVNQEAQGAGEGQSADMRAENPVPDNGSSETAAESLVPNSVVAEDAVFCPSCGARNKSTDVFCGSCGAPLNQVQVVPNIQGTYTAPQKPKKKKAPVIIGGFVAVAVLALVVFAAVNLFGGGSGKGDSKPLLYLKDNELTLASGRKHEPLHISDDYFDSSSEGDLYTRNSSPLQYTKDGKYMFYKRNIRDGVYDVYYQKVGGKNSDAQKLDSDVLSYSVISKNKIVYLRDETDRRLYLASLEDEEKIASDVENYAVSSDDKYVVWEERDGEEYKLYVQALDGKGEKEKIDTITGVIDFSDDLKTLVYKKDDALYVCRDFTEKEKIASDVGSVYTFNIDDKLEMYYTKSEDMEEEEDAEEGSYSGYTLYDLFDDDLADSDAAMTEPNISDYQSITYEDSYWGRREVVKTSDSYYNALDAYEEKLYRDNFRKSLQEQPLEVETVSIYYYAQGDDSGELVAEVESVDDSIYSVIGADSAMLCYFNFDYDSMEKMKFSNWVNSDSMNANFYTEIMKNMVEGITIELLDGQNLQTFPELDLTELDDLSLYYNRKTDEIYVFSYKGGYSEVAVSEDGTYTDTKEKEGNLHTWNYKKEGADLELLREDVFSVWESSDDGIYYFCEADKDGDSAELYLDDEKLDSDVSPGSLNTGNDDCILYLKDVDSDGEEGSLYCYREGKAEKVADDVAHSSFTTVENGKVVYLTDYSFKRNSGDLMMYNGKESSKIDTDVTCIFTGKTSCYRGYLY